MSTSGAADADLHGSHQNVQPQYMGTTGQPTTSHGAINPSNQSTIPPQGVHGGSFMDKFKVQPPKIVNPNVISLQQVNDPAFLQSNLPIPALDSTAGKWAVVNQQWLSEHSAKILPSAAMIPLTIPGALSTALPTTQLIAPTPPPQEIVQLPNEQREQLLNQVLSTIPYHPSSRHVMDTTWPNSANGGYDHHEIELGGVVSCPDVPLQYCPLSMDLQQMIYYFGSIKIIPLTSLGYEYYFVPFFPSGHSSWTFWETIVLLQLIMAHMQHTPSLPINWYQFTQHPVLSVRHSNPLDCETHYGILQRLSGIHLTLSIGESLQYQPYMSPIQSHSYPYDRLLLVPPSTFHQPSPSVAAGGDHTKPFASKRLEIYGLPSLNSSIVSLTAVDYQQQYATVYPLVGVPHPLPDIIPPPAPLNVQYINHLQVIRQTPIEQVLQIPIISPQPPPQPQPQQLHPSTATTSSGRPARRASKYATPSDDEHDYDDDGNDYGDESDSDDDDDDDDDDDAYDDDDDDTITIRNRHRSRKSRTGGSGRGNRSSHGDGMRPGGGSSRRTNDLAVPGMRPPPVPGATRTSARRQEQMQLQQAQHDEYLAMQEENMANMPRRRSNRTPTSMADDYDNGAVSTKSNMSNRKISRYDEYDDDATTSSSEEEISYSDDDDGAGNYYHSNRSKAKAKKLAAARRNRRSTAGNQRLAQHGPTSSGGASDDKYDGGDDDHDDYGNDGDDDYDDHDAYDNDDDGMHDDHDPALQEQAYYESLTPTEQMIYRQKQQFEMARKKLSQPRIEKILAVREVKKQLTFKLHGESIDPLDMYYDNASQEIIFPEFAPLLLQEQQKEYESYLQATSPVKSSTTTTTTTTTTGITKEEASEKSPAVSLQPTTTNDITGPSLVSSAITAPSSGDVTTATSVPTDEPGLHTSTGFYPLPPPGLTFDEYYQWKQDQDDIDAYEVYYQELIECVAECLTPPMDDYTILGLHYDIAIQFEQEPDSEAEPLDYEAISQMSPFQYQAYIDLREQKRVERQKIKQERRRQEAQAQAHHEQPSATVTANATTNNTDTTVKKEYMPLSTMTDGDKATTSQVKLETSDSTTGNQDDLVKKELPSTAVAISRLPMRIQRLEYLVKPQDVSYRHIQWLSPTNLMLIYGKRHAQDRVKRFLAKREETENYNLDKFGGEHFDSKFINIDRILSQRVALLSYEQLKEMKKTVDAVKGLVIPPFHSVALSHDCQITVFPTPKEILEFHHLPANILELTNTTPVNPHLQPCLLNFSHHLLKKLTDEQHGIFDQLEQQYETHFFAHNISEYCIDPKFSKQTYDGDDNEGGWDDDDDYNRGDSNSKKKTIGATSSSTTTTASDDTNKSADTTTVVSEVTTTSPDGTVSTQSVEIMIPKCTEKVVVIEFLLKWNGLSYTHATWEPQFQLTHDVNEIKRFIQYNRPLTPQETAPKQYNEQEQMIRQQRAAKWYDESPKYRNDMELRQYQVEGVNWLIELFIKKQNGILADEMGLGKTVQCVAFLEHLYTQENIHGPFLVVTPLSTLNNWKRESDLWTTQNVVIYHDATGGSTGREELRKYEFYSSFYPQMYDKTSVPTAEMLSNDTIHHPQQQHPHPLGVSGSGDPTQHNPHTYPITGDGMVNTNNAITETANLPPGYALMPSANGKPVVATANSLTNHVEVHHPRSSKGHAMLQSNDVEGSTNTLLPVKFNILITSYEMMMSDVAFLRTIPFQYVIIDEGHKLKNQNAKLADAFKELPIERKLLLTGTPIQNNTNELFALLHFIHPEVFNNRERFMERFGELNDAAQVAELQKTISPYLLRRMKETVEKSIPNKEETIIDVELTTLQKIYYRAIYEKNLKFLKQGGTGQNAPKLINIEAELRKCCNHPWLVRGVEEKEIPPGASEEEYYNATIQASGKLVLLDKLLPKLFEDGHRVLIFSQMVTLLDIISEYLRYRKYKFERLDGNVTGDQRDAAIERFCRPDSDRFIFLLSTRAGGVGLNLTSADTVIIYDSDWNPQQDVQAQARAHRIGQKNNVLVYRLITRNTYESEMFSRASKKLGLDYAVLKRLEKGGKRQQEATASEIDKILRLGAYGMLDEDDAQRQAFFDSNIEDILKNNSRVISSTATPNPNTTGVVDFQKQYFSAESSEQAKLDINDANFWSHILGNDDEYKCQPDVLQSRLNDTVTLKSDPQKAVEFFNDISKLMYNTFERIKAVQAQDGDNNSNTTSTGDGGDDDDDMASLSTTTSGNSTGPSALTLEEIDELIALLIQFTSTVEIFQDEHLAKGQVWLGELEMRTSRRKNHINYRSANLYNDNDNTVQHNRSSRGKLFNKRMRQQYGNDEEEDYYNYNSEDEENIDPLKRRVPPVNFHETDRGIEYTDRAGINNEIQLIVPKRGRGARPIYNVAVCSVCYCPGELLSCDGPCQRLMHVECMPKGVPKFGCTSKKDNIFHRLNKTPSELLSTVSKVNQAISIYNEQTINTTREHARKYNRQQLFNGMGEQPSSQDEVLVEGLIRPVEDNNEDYIKPNGMVIMPSLLDSKKPWVCIECQEQTWRCFGCDYPVTTNPNSVLGSLMNIAVQHMMPNKDGEEGSTNDGDGPSSTTSTPASGGGGQKRRKNAAANSRDHDVRFCSVANCGRVAHLGCARQNKSNHFYGKTEVLSAFRCSIHFCDICARKEESDKNKTDAEREQDREKQRQKQGKRIYVDADEDEDDENGDTANDGKRGAKVSENSMILCICCSVGYHTRCLPYSATRLARKTMLCVECTKTAFTNSLGRRVIAFSQNPFTMKILRERVKVKYNAGGDNSHINAFTPQSIPLLDADGKHPITASPHVKKLPHAVLAQAGLTTNTTPNAQTTNAASNPINVFPSFNTAVKLYDDEEDALESTRNDDNNTRRSAVAKREAAAANRD